MSIRDFVRNKVNVDKNIKFQVLSWNNYDEEVNEDEYDLEYKIYMMGNTEEGHSVCLKVDEFTPYFFVKVPEELQDKWSEFHTTELKNYLSNKLYKFKKGLVKVSLIEKKDIDGYTNGKYFKFIKIIVKSKKVFTKCKYILTPTIYRGKPIIPNISINELDFKLYEGNIEPFIRFCHIQDITPAGWITIDKFISEENSRCQIDIATKWSNVKPLHIDKICPFTVVSYDIEAISQRGKDLQKNIFPDYNLETDCITQIGATLYKFGTNIMLETMHTLISPVDKCVDDIENVTKFEYESEKDLILGFFDFLRDIDADYITGYNINVFDWNYINERCKLLGIEHMIGPLSRLNEYSAKFVEEQLISSAAGENKFKYIQIPGVINSDLYTIIKREQKLVSYKLDFVAETHIGEHKNPLTPLDIFNMAIGTSSEVATVCSYCSKDCVLVIQLIKKLCIIPNMFCMANVTLVPIEYIESKGQQIKVHSQLTYDARKDDYLVPSPIYKDSDIPDEKFTGATVQEAIEDAHFVPVSGLDFASLYPSIMIAYNFSYETRIKDSQYENLENVDYHEVIWKEDEGTSSERTERVVFAQNIEGILPRILSRLWKERKAIKKEMKVIKGEIKELQKEEKTSEIESKITTLEFLYQVKDGFQLAMKVSMNSIYGFTGASVGRLPDKRIAAAVTASGRRMIQECKEYVESTYDCKVVYGDSVAEYTPIYIYNKITKRINIIKIKDLEYLIDTDDNENKWKKVSNDTEKEYIELSKFNIYTWTDDGLTHLKRIIRHKLHPSKQMIRILTPTGLVDVTDDHSLLKKDKTVVSPKDIVLGMELLHNKCPLLIDNNETITYEVVDDTFVFNNQIDCALYCNTQNNIEINYYNDKYYVKHKNCDNKEQIINFEKIDYSNNKYVYDLTTDNNHFAAGIGSIIVHNTDSIYVKFFTEFKGQEHMDEVFRLSEIAAEGCSKLFKKPIDMEFEKVMDPFILFCKKRYACVVWTNPHKHDYIDYKGIQVVRRDNCPLIKDKSVEIFEHILLQKDIPKSVDLAREAIKNLIEGNVPIKDLIISKSLKGYGSYEFDKQVICKECGKRWYTIDELTQKKVYKIPMKEKKTLEENLKDFMANEHYCFTCKKNTNYKNNEANIAHVALARKMEKRDPYNCPVVGERVPYVFKKTVNKKDSQFQKVEDPDYLVRNCIELDYEYYFEHQLKSALDTIFGPILKDKLEQTLYSGIIPEKQKRTRKTKNSSS